MVSFGGTPRFQGPSRPGASQTPSNRNTNVTSASPPTIFPPTASRANQLGIGLGGKGGIGLGKGKSLKRHKKIARDTIRGVTKGDIRRLARRGGVKRISAMVYDDMRLAMKAQLTRILHDIVALVEHSGRKTVSVTDVIWALNRQGKPLYGFDASFDGRHR